jgi:hypothetical protein
MIKIDFKIKMTTKTDTLLRYVLEKHSELVVYNSLTNDRLTSLWDIKKLVKVSIF